MNRRLKRIGPLKFGIVVGACYALLSLIIVPFLLIASVAGMFLPNSGGGGGVIEG